MSLQTIHEESPFPLSGSAKSLSESAKSLSESAKFLVAGISRSLLLRPPPKAPRFVSPPLKTRRSTNGWLSHVEVPRHQVEDHADSRLRSTSGGPQGPLLGLVCDPQPERPEPLPVFFRLGRVRQRGQGGAVHRPHSSRSSLAQETRPQTQLSVDSGNSRNRKRARGSCSTWIRG